jgi:hypothetical protein
MHPLLISSYFMWSLFIVFVGVMSYKIWKANRPGPKTNWFNN